MPATPVPAAEVSLVPAPGERTLVICVRPDASVETLHNDGLGLDSLGPKTVKRASNVEYDAGGQVWYVEDAATGQRLHEDPTRDVCIRWEVEHFNARLREGFRPFDG